MQTPEGFRLVAQGRASWFGGPKDRGVTASEDLALIFPHEIEDPRTGKLLESPWKDLFLPEQPPGTTGLARRLDSEGKRFIAIRFQAHSKGAKITPEQEKAIRQYYRTHPLLVCSEKFPYPQGFWALLVDWGPDPDETDKDADLSYRLLIMDLQADTGEQVWIFAPLDDSHPMALSHPGGADGMHRDLAVMRVPSISSAPPVDNRPQSGAVESPGGTTMAEEQTTNPTPGAVAPAPHTATALTILERFSQLDLVHAAEQVNDLIHLAQSLFSTPGTGAQKKEWVIGQLKAGPVGEFVNNHVTDPLQQMFVWVGFSKLIDAGANWYQSHHGPQWGTANAGKVAA